MKLLVLSLEEDAMEWNLGTPHNFSDSLQAIINASKINMEKGKQVLSQNHQEHKEKDEFNKKFNGIVKEIHQDYKPTDKSLLEYFIQMH